MSDIEDEHPPVLLPCTVCSRTFRPEVLERHTKVCEKSAAKKRRVFDSFKSRVTGTELEEFLGPAPLPGQPLKRSLKSPVKKKAPSRWKETHENLIATLRAARGAEPLETMSDASKPAGNEQCPSCNRFFGPRAFDRHVGFCKEKTARIKLTHSKVAQAQERLEARTKYRAPLSIKPKLTTKEKYSPMLPRKESSESCSISISSAKTSPLPTLHKNSKPVRQNSGSFSRQNPIRSSERNRSVSPLKKVVTSISKPNVKNEVPVKLSNHHKIKENTKTPENLSPKAGTKASAQEKIRSSNIKLTQSEAETDKQLKKLKKKREKIAPKSNIPSDNESNGTVESEISETSYKRIKSAGSKWSSLGSIKNAYIPLEKEKSKPETDKISLELESDSEKCRTKTRDDPKSAKKGKQQKQIINDLSVNDESFGIFVAPCSTRPSSHTRTKTKMNILKESSETTRLRVKKGKNYSTPIIELKPEESEKMEQNIEKNPDRKSTVAEIFDSQNEIFKIEKEKKPKIIEKASKIPKPKLELNNRIPSKKEKRQPECDDMLLEERVDETVLYEVEVVRESKTLAADDMKKKSKKWRNIADIPTEELAQISEDFAITEQENEELSHSAIWEIAGEQFLNSEEPDQIISTFSLDSLNETEDKKVIPDVPLKKRASNEDPFETLRPTNDESKLVKLRRGRLYFAKTIPDGVIVLHPPDPSKMVENDTEMKLSISEPCFPFSGKISKLNSKIPENTNIDIVVFTAFPTALQPKISHRKRGKQKRLKQPSPKFSYIREKTFSTDDFPKAKRRRTTVKDVYPWQDFREYYFGTFSNDFDERKKKFIQGLKNHREKIRKWHAVASTHVQFMEGFQKTIEDDLKELKNLFEGEKRSCSGGKLKKEKPKNVIEDREKSVKKDGSKKGKNFEYFEISLDDEKPNERINEKEKPKNLKESFVDCSCNESKKTFQQKSEFFEIPKVDLAIKSKRGKGRGKKEVVAKDDQEESEKENSYDNLKGSKERLENHAKAETVPKNVQITSSLNSSLENIEEMDENLDEQMEEFLNTFRKNIEIEDFILAKPDTKKLLSKDGNCLSQLFPKPRKISELFKTVQSKTVVHLDYAADSVYDLKSEEHKITDKLPEISNRQKGKILEKRMAKVSQLPQISAKSSIEKKENSMIFLIEMWKHKKGSSENEKLYKTKATLPSGKLAPLTNKNTSQIGDSDDSYDPFKQAERQMLALLSWPSTADIKATKDLSATPKPNSKQKSNLETSPTSAFTKYPNKSNETKNEKTTNARRNLSDTFEVKETAKKKRNEKPTYTAADDWEQIFEQHFDLNRNEMADQMSRTVKSALNGLLKNTIKNKTNISGNVSPEKNKTDTPENSIITDILYTSTPNPKSDRSTKARSKDSTIDLDQTPNTYRKNTNFAYDRVSPPEDFHESNEKGKKEEKKNRNSGISLSSLSFCSQISDTTLADEEVMRSNLEIVGKAAATARTPRRKYIRSQSVFDERNKMLFAKTFDPNYSSSDENDVEILPKIIDKQENKSPSRNPHPKSFPSHFYRSQSAVEDRIKRDGDHTDDRDQISSPESNRNRKGKLSGDSAYSSLNRKSPRQNIQNNQQEDRLSSSASDHSLPTTDFELKPKCLDFEKNPKKKNQPVKMSKFCHECGSKYPVAVAKFCCECGVRRLII